MPKPRYEATKSQKPYRGDAIAFVVALLSTTIGVTLTIVKIAEGWHHAQDMGTIAPIPFVLSRWWIHARYIVEVTMELWILGAVRRNQKWGFVLLALLSASWLVPAVTGSNWFYVFDNAFTLVYPLVRLLGWLGPPPEEV